MGSIGASTGAVTRLLIALLLDFFEGTATSELFESSDIRRGPRFFAKIIIIMRYNTVDIYIVTCW